MESRLDRLSRCLAICSETDYGSPASVKQHNAAATEMREIAKEAFLEGPNAVLELASLLDNADAAPTVAHLLLECGSVAGAIEERCLAVIKEVASGKGLEALGNRIWLRDYLEKRQTP